MRPSCEPHVAEELRAHAARAAPAEACGLLFGPPGTLHAVHYVACENRAADRLRAFAIDPLAFARAEHEARTRGLVLVGIFHSHPRGPLEPSAVDRATAWRDVGHWIGDATGGLLAHTFATDDRRGT